MAGNEPGDGIAPDGLTHCPGGTGPVDCLRESAISGQLAFGDGQQRLPHADLKIGAGQVYQHLSVASGGLDDSPSGGIDRRRVVFHGGVGPGGMQLGQRLIACPVDKRQGADTAGRESDQGGAIGGVTDTPAQGQAGATGAVLTRGHGVDRNKMIVQPPGSRQAGSITRAQHAFRGAEQRLGMFHGEVLEILFWRDTGPPPEQALEVEGAQARRVRHRIQARLGRLALVEEGDGPGNTAVVPGRLFGLLHFQRLIHDCSLATCRRAPTRILRGKHALVSANVGPMDERDSPDRGPAVFIPPPLFFAVGLGISWWLEGRWPWPIAEPVVWLEVTGALLVVASMAGVLWAAGRFGRAGTPIVPVKAATVLVTDGPFGHSRNPMYVSLTAGYVGVGLILNSWWAIVLLPGALLVIRFWVIAREEAYLAGRFGEEYAAYCRRVRRWF